MKISIFVIVLSIASVCHAQKKIKVKSVSNIFYQEGSSFNIDIVSDTVVFANAPIAYTITSKNSGAIRSADFVSFSPFVDTITIKPGDSIGRLMMMGKLDDLDEGDDTFLFRITSVPSGFVKIQPDSFWIILRDSTYPTAGLTDLVRIGIVRGGNSGGIPDFVGIKCTLRGILYGVNTYTTGYNMSICDHTGCIGIVSDYIYNNYPTAKEGDSVEISGEITQIFGLGRMRFNGFGDTILLRGYRQANAAALVTKLDETTESKYIKIENLRLVGGKWTSDSVFSLYMRNPKNDLFEVYIQNSGNRIGSASVEPIKYGKWYTIMGLGSQRDMTGLYSAGYQIIPQKLGDIIATGVASVDATSNAEEMIRVFPNPVVDGTVNLSLYSDSKSSATLSIMDIQGKLVYSKTIGMISGLNQYKLENIKHLSTGSHFLKLNSDQFNFTKQLFVIQE